MHQIGLDTDGTTYGSKEFGPYMRVDGPAIIQLDVVANAASASCAGGFDVYTHSGIVSLPVITPF